MTDWFRWERGAWNQRQFLSLDDQEFRLLFTMKALLPYSGIGVLGDRRIRVKSRIDEWEPVMERLVRLGWIQRQEDWSGEIVYWLVNGLAKEVKSPRDNRVKHIRRQVLRDVPRCDLRSEFMARYAYLLAPSEGPSEGPSQAPSYLKSKSERKKLPDVATSGRAEIAALAHLKKPGAAALQGAAPTPDRETQKALLKRRLNT